MKALYLIVFILSFFLGYSAYAEGPCDQKVYDEIYLTIIQRTMDTKLTHEDFVIRNTTIQRLRKLCHGQTSTYEKGLP